MKIASPLSRIKEVAPMARAGAGEFYAGLLSGEWSEKFGLVESVSRRNSPGAHFTSVQDLKDAVMRAHHYGIRVHGVLNETYHGGQLDLLKRQVHEYKNACIDGIITGDLAVLLTLREMGYDGFIIMGTGGVTLNEMTAELYYSLGAGRIILPRHLSPKEISIIVKNGPPVEYEVFIFRGLCPFIDGYCRFTHGLGSVLNLPPKKELACNLKFRISTCPALGCSIPPENREIKKDLSPRQSLTGCGLCAMPDLLKIPSIAAMKIVGREFSSREKLENLKIVKKFADMAGSGGDEYRKLCREAFRQFFGRPCNEKDCYHPQYAGDSGENANGF